MKNLFDAATVLRRVDGVRGWRGLRAAMAWGAAACGALSSRAASQDMPAKLTQFLTQTVGLSQDEIETAARGTPVVRKLAPADRREIALIGLVRIGVSRSFYVQGAADFATSLLEPSRLGFGLFSNPAATSDVAGFSLPHDDVEDLARCRPGSCKLKLSAEAISQSSASIDLHSPRADSVATALFRDRMVDYVTAYRARGDAALIAYDDSPDSEAATQVLDAMLSRSPFMYQYAPSLERYLRNYPRDRPAGVREAIFWALDDLAGAKPMLTMTHEIVYDPPELPGVTLIAAKQLYCDHYLDGALDLTAIVEETRQQGPHERGIYVVLLRRLHFDDLPSGGLLDVRGRVTGKVRDRTEAFLGDAKAHAEREYVTPPR